MGWIFKSNPFDFLDFVEERLNHEVLGDIFAAIGDECGDANEVQTIDNWPILQDAYRKRRKCVNMENSWTLQLTYGAEATVGSPSGPNTWSKAYQYSAGTGRIIHPWTEWNSFRAWKNFSGSFIPLIKPCFTSSEKACMSCPLDWFQRLDAASELAMIKCFSPAGCLRTSNSEASIPPQEWPARSNPSWMLKWLRRLTSSSMNKSIVQKVGGFSLRCVDFALPSWSYRMTGTLYFSVNWENETR